MSDYVFQPPMNPITEVKPSTSGLGKALWIMMIITSVSYLITLFVYLAYTALFVDLTQGYLSTSDSNEIDSAYNAARGWDAISSLLSVAVFVLLIIFLYRFVRKLVAAGYPTPMSPGLAIGGWFIPVAQAIIPYIFFRRIARELKYGNAKLQVFLNLWWWPWVLGAISLLVGRSQTSNAMSLDDLQSGALFCVTAYALLLFGMIFGVLFVAKSNKIFIQQYRAQALLS